MDDKQPDPVAPTHEQDREEEDPRGTKRSDQLPEDVPEGTAPDRADEPAEDD